LVSNKVDAFIIGSEMKGLTQIQFEDSFPAVNEFINLAQEIKSIMGNDTKISYAADWSEYHSVNGWYNLDDLWASDYIDFIGIDAYFPLTDRPQNNNYNLQEVIDGWTQGEGYEWYYNDLERTEKLPLSNQYAWKNIEWWWNNNHYNPNSLQTDWQPQSKKIWFTEFGFPSIDGATNQPNIFYNPESSESGFPYHSLGYNDFLAQKLGIEATLLKWKNSEMVEEKFLWVWDARPYPFWPDMNSVWSDGYLWAKGHWVNGKLGSSNLGNIVQDICKKCDIDTSKIDTKNLNKNIDGFVLNARITGLKAIEKLSDANFFEGIETNNLLNFYLKGTEQEIVVYEDELVEQKNNKKLVINYLPEGYLPSQIDITFIDKFENYRVNSTVEIRDSLNYKQIYETNLPIVISANLAKNIAETYLNENWISRKSYSFALGLEYIYLDVGDVLAIKLNSGLEEKVKITKINFQKTYIEVKGKAFENSIYQNYDFNDNISSGIINPVDAIVSTKYEVLDIASLPSEDTNNPYLKFAISGSNNNWKGAEIFYSLSDSNYQSLGLIQASATTGNCINKLENANSFLFDKINNLEIFLLNGSLESVSRNDILNGFNLALIGDEIVQFQNADFINNGHYILSNFLRGRLGTENKTNSHIAGERFILLNDFILKAQLPKSAIGADLFIKVVSLGENINNVTHNIINFQARNLAPYSPVNFEAKKLPNGDIVFNWNRRCREFSAWRDFIDVPNLERSEIYNLSILDDSNQIIRTISLNNNNFNYSQSMQITDFGTDKNSINAICYQTSENTGYANKTEKSFYFS
jgi:hypothetical protein